MEEKQLFNTLPNSSLIVLIFEGQGSPTGERKLLLPIKRLGQNMEGEIWNFMRVWASTIASVSYSYAVARIVGKGFLRLITFSWFSLSLSLGSVHLGCPTVFFISWLANFNLLLLAFGNGPLSQPSLSLCRFVCIACFPIEVREEDKKPSEP